MSSLPLPPEKQANMLTRTHTPLTSHGEGSASFLSKRCSQLLYIESQLPPHLPVILPIPFTPLYVFPSDFLLHSAFICLLYVCCLWGQGLCVFCSLLNPYHLKQYTPFSEGSVSGVSHDPQFINRESNPRCLNKLYAPQLFSSFTKTEAPYPAKCLFDSLFPFWVKALRAVQTGAALYLKKMRICDENLL